MEEEKHLVLSNANLCLTENDHNRTETETLKEVSSVSNANLGAAENDQNGTEYTVFPEEPKELSSLSNANLGSAEKDQNITENYISTEILKEVPPPSFSDGKLFPGEDDQNRTEDDRSPENEMLKEVFGDDLLTSSGQEIEKIDKTYSRGKNPNILPGNKEHSLDEESAEQIINSEEINEHLKSGSKELTVVSNMAEDSEDSKHNIPALNTIQSTSVHSKELEKTD